LKEEIENLKERLLSEDQILSKDRKADLRKQIEEFV
jgi:hypothetical protein